MFVGGVHQLSIYVVYPFLNSATCLIAWSSSTARFSLILSPCGPAGWSDLPGRGERRQSGQPREGKGETELAYFESTGGAAVLRSMQGIICIVRGCDAPVGYAHPEHFEVTMLRRPCFFLHIYVCTYGRFGTVCPPFTFFVNFRNKTN